MSLGNIICLVHRTIQSSCPLNPARALCCASPALPSLALLRPKSPRQSIEANHADSHHLNHAKLDTTVLRQAASRPLLPAVVVVRSQRLKLPCLSTIEVVSDAYACAAEARRASGPPKPLAHCDMKVPGQQWYAPKSSAVARCTGAGVQYKFHALQEVIV
jgi:hypothetical protein